ncbi:hypothetical protein BRAS3843_1480048 [Bradyrhizobium sp. STM 3843]|uniref:hypothetical protein n=1 Tax=Bradyrhizobium sp. STM 3843 TaxID=551947 RepID=UPI0002406BBB|nr:hypothetical protein [Bradyrhizobium sp. STM 3843]CCE05817.1 hypothetical protein BRAS3843_1480048 [Bradyrhizobium sp. STM 3843]
MSSTHTIIAEIEVRFSFPGLADGEYETDYPVIEIEYSFLRGSPATRPSFSSPGEPADPDEIDLISARLINGGSIDPTEDLVQTWAREWLHGDGYFEACAHAKRGPDPDDLLQQRRDDADFHAQSFYGDDF